MAVPWTDTATAPPAVRYVVCPWCGALVPEGYERCPYCLARLLPPTAGPPPGRGDP